MALHPRRHLLRLVEVVFVYFCKMTQDNHTLPLTNYNTFAQCRIQEDMNTNLSTDNFVCSGDLIRIPRRISG